MLKSGFIFLLSRGDAPWSLCTHPPLLCASSPCPAPQLLPEHGRARTTPGYSPFLGKRKEKAGRCCKCKAVSISCSCSNPAPPDPGSEPARTGAGSGTSLADAHVSPLGMVARGEPPVTNSNWQCGLCCTSDKLFSFRGRKPALRGEWESSQRNPFSLVFLVLCQTPKQPWGFPYER